MVHSKVKNFICKQCEQSFYLKKNLKEHVSRMHLKIKPLKKLKCSECKAGFETKEHLEHHMNSVHLKTRVYKCADCKKCCDSYKELKQHHDRVHKELKVTFSKKGTNMITQTHIQKFNSFQ